MFLITASMQLFLQPVNFNFKCINYSLQLQFFIVITCPRLVQLNLINHTSGTISPVVITMIGMIDDDKFIHFFVVLFDHKLDLCLLSLSQLLVSVDFHDQQVYLFLQRAVLCLKFLISDFEFCHFLCGFGDLLGEFLFLFLLLLSLLLHLFHVLPHQQLVGSMIRG